MDESPKTQFWESHRLLLVKFRNLTQVCSFFFSSKFNLNLLFKTQPLPPLEKNLHSPHTGAGLVTRSPVHVSQTVNDIFKRT